MTYQLNLITVRNEVAKVMFLQVSVCPQGGGGIPACLAGGIPVCLTTGLQGAAWFQRVSALGVVLRGVGVLVSQHALRQTCVKT